MTLAELAVLIKPRVVHFPAWPPRFYSKSHQIMSPSALFAYSSKMQAVRAPCVHSVQCECTSVVSVFLCIPWLPFKHGVPDSNGSGPQVSGRYPSAEILRLLVASASHFLQRDLSFIAVPTHPVPIAVPCSCLRLFLFVCFILNTRVSTPEWLWTYLGTRFVTTGFHFDASD